MQWSPASGGAIISFGDESIRIYTSDGLPLNNGDLTNDDILNVDRPPLLAVNQVLTGGGGADTLNGGFGDDTIQGAAGDDVLTGQEGDDSILGGAGLNGTAGADQLMGSDVAEVLLGGEGDDTISDGAGEDTLWGDAGADLFVMAADGQLDIVEDFERGVDKLDLSGWDFLYDVSQLQWSPASGGAIISFGDESLRIYTSDGLPLNNGDLTNEDILNVDRPPLLAVNQVLTGGSEADTLNGGFGDDTIQGAAGDDVLTGQEGDDSILGGAGSDTLDGGSGADTLEGQSEDDTIVGGLGDDVIDGGAGGDLIYGDEFDWAGA